METSKITRCRFLKSYDSKFGTMYSHYIELANGDTGEISAKNEMPVKFAPGQELTYELTPNPNPKYSAKIKAVNPKFAGQSQSNPQQSNAVIQQLTERIEKLENVIKSLVKNNKLIYTSEPALSQQKPVVNVQETINEVTRNRAMQSMSDINPPDSDLPF